MKTAAKVGLGVLAVVLVSIGITGVIALTPLFLLSAELERQQPEVAEYQPEPAGPLGEADPAAGGRLAQDIDDYFTLRHGSELLVETTVSKPDAEVGVELRPADGEVDPERMQRVWEKFAWLEQRYADSGWRIDSQVTGELAGRPARVFGFDAANWVDLSESLKLPAGEDSSFVIDLATREAYHSWELNDPGFCGDAGQWREFYAAAAAESQQSLRSLGWELDHRPSLNLEVSACDGDLKLIAQLGGTQRNDKIQALAEIPAAVPADVRLTDLRLLDAVPADIPAARTGLPARLQVRAEYLDGTTATEAAQQRFITALGTVWPFTGIEWTD